MTQSMEVIRATIFQLPGVPANVDAGVDSNANAAVVNGKGACQGHDHVTAGGGMVRTCTREDRDMLRALKKSA